MESEVHRDLGKHDAQIDGLKNQIEVLHQDMQRLNTAVSNIQQTLSEAKGGWRTLMMIAGAGAACGVTATKLLAWLIATPGPK